MRKIAVNTRDAAALLGRAPQTLRHWAMEGNGPIAPIEFSRGGPLLWRIAEIEKLLGVSIADLDLGAEPRAVAGPEGVSRV